MKAINGLVVQSRHLTHIVIYLGNERWGLMSICSHRDPTLTAPLFYHGKDGRWQFSSAEIADHTDGWIVVPQRLELVMKEATKS